MRENLDWLGLFFLLLPRIRQRCKLAEECSSAADQGLSHLSLFSRCQKTLEIKSERWIMGSWDGEGILNTFQFQPCAVGREHPPGGIHSFMPPGKTPDPKSLTKEIKVSTSHQVLAVFQILSCPFLLVGRMDPKEAFAVATGSPHPKILVVGGNLEAVCV